MFNKALKKKIKDYQEVFGTEQGTRVLYDMAESCNMLTTTFDENPYEMARKEGARESVIGILNLLKVNIFEIESAYKKLEALDAIE